MSTTIIKTKGKGVKQVFSHLHRHPSLGSEMANFDLAIGDDEIHIDFGSWDEMIRFCDKHNFSYIDKRTGVEKYLSRQKHQSTNKTGEAS